MDDDALQRLGRLSTPTVANGWEQITQSDPARDAVSLEPVVDFMPELGPMVGRAITLVIEPSNPGHPVDGVWDAWRDHVVSVPGPKVVVVQDLDKPAVLGAFWGEVNSTVHRGFGCVGTITDGGVRDLEEMRSVGFKALAARACVGHAWVRPVRWGEAVEVFGRTIFPGQLVHADRHGFLAVPAEDEDGLADAAEAMDAIERSTLIAAAAATYDDDAARVAALRTATEAFDAQVRQRFGGFGEFA
jgi:regulator of RNase E activity RraA